MELILNRKPYDESIFLTYGNAPLKNSPEGLYATLDQIEKYLNPLSLKIKDSVDRLVWVSKLEYGDKIKALYESGHMAFLKQIEKEKELLREMHREKRFYGEATRSYQVILDPGQKVEKALKTEAKKDGEKVMEVLESVYGSLLVGCSNHPETNPLGCRWGQIRKKIFEIKGLKCFECDHEHFVHILNALIEGKDYSEIAGLKVLIDSYRPPRTSLTISLEEDTNLQEITAINNLKLSYGGLMSFPKIFYGVVTQSLIDFLINNDRRRLKRCTICANFFIAGNTRRDICSEDCHQTYMRNYLRPYMKRKRDKDGPDFDPKYI